MAMKLKVDLSGVKNFFFDKGDKLALLLCLALMGILVGFGILNGVGARSVPGSTGTTYGEALSREAKVLWANFDNPAKKPTLSAEAVVFPDPAWRPQEPRFQGSQLFSLPDNTGVKRVNPQVLPILASPDRKEIQMDYVRGIYYAYEVDHESKSIWVVKEQPQLNQPGVVQPMPKVKGPVQKKDVTPTVVTRPVRMVVVHAVVPLRAQLSAFQGAFRMKTLSELFESKDLPKYLGMNILKAEVVDGKVSEWKPFIYYDPRAEKVEVSAGIRQLLREGFFDKENSLVNNQPFLIQGLAMPLPKLATLPFGEYPEVKLAGAGLDFDWEKAGALGGGGNIPGMAAPNFMQGGGVQGGGRGGAMPGAVAGQEVEFIARPWKKLSLPAEIAEKLDDNFNVLDPVGIHFDPDMPRGAQMPAFQPGGIGGVNVNPYLGGSPFAAAKFWEAYPPPPATVAVAAGPGKGGQPVMRSDPKSLMKPWDGMVRFFDPEVRPGRTYKYMIQLRMANPNYNKKTEVAFAGLALAPELPPSKFVETPTITIPEEFHLYAIDQAPAFKVKNGSDEKDKDKKASHDHVSVQIHRWVDETSDPEQNVKIVVGDWAIAERLLIRRGQPVGRVVNVEVPVWKKEKNTFELGAALEGGAVAKAKGVKGGFPRQPPMPNPAMAAGQPAPTTGVGIPVDFAQTTPPPVLVDFDGGHKEVKFGNVTVKDESASNLLILQSDGKLIVRSNRFDSDSSTPEYAERAQRIEEWKKKTAPFRVPEGTNTQRLPGIFPGVNKGS